MLKTLLPVLPLLAGGVRAVTEITPSAMTGWMDAGGVQLALQAAPMWFFGQAMNQPPCIPTFAVQNGQQTPSVADCDYPNVGCNCRNPGVAIGNPAPSFPVYFTYQQCNDTEIRVAYNLFYQKDGTNPVGVLGHPFDWEGAIVVWGKNGNSNWVPSQLFMSQHSGYGKFNWADIQNTLNTADAGQSIGGANGRQNLDHAKIYVAWSKHANYDDRNTGWNDPLSQLTGNAFRSQDWWYLPVADDYIRADLSTTVGQQIQSFNYGDATSTPPTVHANLCSR